MRLIDLSHTFTHHMPVFPGDAVPIIQQVSNLANDGCVAHAITTSMHVGTHMDAPMHMVEGGKSVAEIPLQHCMGQGVLIDARGQRIIEDTVLDSYQIQPGDVVLFCTGWSEK